MTLRSRTFYAPVTHPNPGPSMQRKAEAELINPRLMSAGICLPDRAERARRYAYENAFSPQLNRNTHRPGQTRPS